MLSQILIFVLLTSQAFAHTECYFDNKFEDETFGFILEDHQVTLMAPYRKFTQLEKNGTALLLKGEAIGLLNLFFPLGIIELGHEASSFECTVWNAGRRG